MKNVVFRGPCLTNSGYGVHSRQIFRWLLANERAGNIKLYCQPTGWGITTWSISPDRYEGLAGEIMQRSINLDVKPDISFQVQLPFEWDHELASYNVGITAGIETDRCHESWHQHIQKMDSVIVPSEHAKRSMSGAFSSKIDVIPESYFDQIASGEKDFDQFDFSTPFNFLLFGQITGNNSENDRKNFYNTVKWFCEEFKEDKKVGLIVKTNRGRSTKIDRLATSQLLTKLLAEVRPSDFPKIHLVHGDLEDADLYRLYNSEKVKALVTLTRGEGFGLPILETAAVGKPVIATNWSAHTEFLRIGSFAKVRYELKSIPKSRSDSDIFAAGSKWAEADEDDAKKKMRKVYENYKQFLDSSQILKKKIIENYSWETIASLYDKKFGDLW
tara:strand:+ start:1842 stop:3002 length:1161 start_codon:yes stop_codon:yes gene_type:complete